MENSKYILIIFISMIVSSALTAAGMTLFAEYTNLFFFIILLSLLIVSSVAVIFIRYKDDILIVITKALQVNKIKDISIQLEEIKNHIINKNAAKAINSLIDFSNKGIDYYFAVLGKRWIVNTMIAVFIGFGAILGSALLYEQNLLIEKQNDNLIEQLNITREQINLSAITESYQSLYSKSETSPLIKIWALNRLKQLNLGSPIDLYNLELSNISLSEFEFNNVNLWNGVFYQSNFDEVEFTEKTNLKKSKFIDCNMQNVTFSNSKLDKTKYLNSRIKNLKFNDNETNNILFKDVVLYSPDFSHQNISVQFENTIIIDGNFKECEFDVNSSMINTTIIVLDSIVSIPKNIKGLDIKSNNTDIVKNFNDGNLQLKSELFSHSFEFENKELELIVSKIFNE